MTAGVCDDQQQEEIKKLIEYLRDGKDMDSLVLVHSTMKIIEKIISSEHWENAKDLMNILKMTGRHIIQAQPSEAIPGNMIRRVLKIIRDEYASCTVIGKHTEGESQEPIQRMFRSEGESHDYEKSHPELQEAILDNIGELMTEIENSMDNITQQALDHILPNTVIMTYGKSKTVQAFLKKAAKKWKFQVVVAEAAPLCQGQEMAKNLALSGIETTLIPDSAIFAVMPRINKVIIGAHSVLANGGMKAVCGAHSIALAAKHHSVPVIVCTDIFKLTPQSFCSHEEDTFNRFASPEHVLGYEEDFISKVQIINPIFDYVPPDLITLFVFNTGGSSPSYVYRQLSELYHPDDNDLSNVN